VEAAFGVAENRARADQVYLSLVEQIAKFWGTLLAIGGYSRGESFVARMWAQECLGRRSMEVEIISWIMIDCYAVAGDGQFYAIRGAA